MRSKGQRWVHSCCSSEALAAALADDNVTAIETDIVLSTVTGQPVMAHPPARHSDLSFEAFLRSCLVGPVKHLKLDFKDPAVVLPCLELLERHKDDFEARGQGLWLNADVLPGPGVDDALFDADDFVKTCCERLPQGVLSLGWRVDLGVGGPYTCKHVDDMLALVRRHHLKDVVLAANLRLTLLAGSPNPLTRVFRDSSCELLLWTGTGEPAVAQVDVDACIAALDVKTSEDLLGFDLKVAPSPSAALVALLAFRLFRLYSRIFVWCFR